MKLKIGTRVTVLPGVSDCRDEGTLQDSARRGQAGKGADRSHFVGMRGEVVQIGTDGPCTCPNPLMVLVDSQMVNGVPQGQMAMREWMLPSELEIG